MPAQVIFSDNPTLINRPAPAAAAPAPVADAAPAASAAPEAAKEPAASSPPPAEQVEGGGSEPKPQNPEPLRRQFAALAKKEADLHQAKQAMVAEKQELEKQIADLKQFQEQFKSDPYAFLEKQGVTYDAWTRRILNDNKPTVNDEVAQLRDELRQLKEAEKAQQQKAAQEQQEVQFQQARKQVLDSIGQYIQNNSDRYPLITSRDANNVVWDVMLEHHRSTGRALSFDEAAGLTESYFADELRAQLKSDKIRAFIGSDQELAESLRAMLGAGAAKEPPQPAQKQSQEPRTLTNNLGAVAGDKTPPGQLTDAERLQRAAEVLRLAKQAAAQ